MIHSPLGSRYAIGGALGRSIKRAAPVAGGWWLSGGISAANCIAAYQPKGAADYAASKANLANPGTYTATDGAAFPTWDATNGWKFAGSPLQFLTTGINPSTLSLKAMIVRFSGAGTSGFINIAGCQSAPRRFIVMTTYNGSQHLYGFGSDGLNITGVALSSGVIAFSDTACYLNGSGDGTISYTNASLPNLNIVIGARNNNGTNDLPYVGNIQAMAIYDTAISAPQVSALTTAMNAL